MVPDVNDPLPVQVNLRYGFALLPNRVTIIKRPDVMLSSSSYGDIKPIITNVSWRVGPTPR
jgi:hypothetical protein